MTDRRDEERDERHLKAVDDPDVPASSKGVSDPSGSAPSRAESDGSSRDEGRESSSEDPSTTSSDAPSDASGENVSSDSSDVESSESERLRSADEGDAAGAGESSETEGLRSVSDDSDAEASGDPDPVTRERDELRETLQRVQADFENFRKRTMRDQTVQLERAAERLVDDLLPVLDSFELAVLSVPEGDLDDAAAKLRKGVELVYAELLGVLEKAGLERIDAHGRVFDPEEHEAVMREGDGDVVTEVMRTGYRLKGRVLRPAMVKVGGPEDEE